MDSGQLGSIKTIIKISDHRMLRQGYQDKPLKNSLCFCDLMSFFTTALTLKKCFCDSVVTMCVLYIPETKQIHQAAVIHCHIESKQLDRYVDLIHAERTIHWAVLILQSTHRYINREFSANTALQYCGNREKEIWITPKTASYL